MYNIIISCIFLFKFYEDYYRRLQTIDEKKNLREIS